MSYQNVFCLEFFVQKSPAAIEETDVLERIRIVPTVATDCKSQLQQIAKARCTLDDNLKKIQHAVSKDLNQFDVEKFETPDMDSLFGYCLRLFKVIINLISL